MSISSFALSLPIHIANSASAEAGKGYDPGIEINKNVPGRDLIETLAGGVLLYAYIILGAALIIAAMVWGIGKISKNGGVQSAGAMSMIWILVAAAVVGSANGLIFFFSKQDLGV